MTEPLERYRRELDELAAGHLQRTRLTLDGPQAGHVEVDGRRLLNFCSNDYLGLANDPRVVEAMQQSAARYGVGSGASHLVNGHRAAHAALEEALAAFVGAERAVTFSTGYMANLAIAQVFAGRGDLVLEDKLNHASLIDAGLLTRADFRRYLHGDAARARRMLGARESGQAVILSDAVFSMDGDIAPVNDLVDAAREHGALAVFDDAHGFGVHGPDGRGTLARFDVPPRGNVLMMGTLGKAIGTFGAFVAGDAVLIELLIQKARTYIYTTALPPALADATRAALDLARHEAWRRDRLRESVARFRAGAAGLDLALLDSDTPIQPVVVGEPERALRMSSALREAGVLVVAIRPPTVPEGTARLRVTFSADHTDDDVDRLLAALDAARGAAD
ncbi:MAG: 8-amino-7-oxononanoate synthase [Gammaproteobacteria bacterium]|nr:8-amino-7-oxononanoate synthase [Gammaproteobacteria bacterium]